MRSRMTCRVLPQLIAAIALSFALAPTMALAETVPGAEDVILNGVDRCRDVGGTLQVFRHNDKKGGLCVLKAAQCKAKGMVVFRSTGSPRLKCDGAVESGAVEIRVE